MSEAKETEKPKYTNRLAKEKSPYLLQHAHNPVDWYPWGEEAFAKAKKEDKPIFLSIGYSTCHWCHVMEVESFENEEIAKLVNDHFVSIKVDREERPDLDNVYMAAVQAMTGQGGWPLTAILTPDGKPFYGGTYFPPESRYGMPGMKELLPSIANAWKTRREELLKSASELTQLLKEPQEGRGGLVLSAEILQKAARSFESTFDPVHGGFGPAPKFPRSHALSFLLWYGYRTGEKRPLETVEKTLEEMAGGGMRDHLGGGFHRYSTDERWLVPHFEKMLYDQALLLRTYVEAYQVTGKPLYAQVARDIIEYVLRDLSDPQGGFYSAEDADSEGEEGKFYVWHPEEVEKILGAADAKLFNDFYGVTPSGNFEHGRSILNVTTPLDEFAKARKANSADLERKLAAGREKLLAARSKRIRPHRDDKILTGWNGLMISSLAYAAEVLEEPRYLEAAGRSADFVLKTLRRDGALLRRYRDGEAAVPGYLDDYAYLILGLLDLYEAGFEARYLAEAKRLGGKMVELFWDEKSGSFFYSGKDAEPLVFNPKEIYDGATPSGNSAAALALLRLGRLTADSKLEQHGRETIRAFSGDLERFPAGYPFMLMAVDFSLGPTREITIAGKSGDPQTLRMTNLVRKRFLPRKTLAFHPEGRTAGEIEALIPYVKQQTSINSKPTAYVCENYACRLPTTDLGKMVELLQ